LIDRVFDSIVTMTNLHCFVCNICFLPFQAILKSSVPDTETQITEQRYRVTDPLKDNDNELTAMKIAENDVIAA